MRNSVDLGELIPFMMCHFLMNIVAHNLNKGQRSQDITAKRNEGKQMIGIDYIVVSARTLAQNLIFLLWFVSCTECFVVPEEILARGPLTLCAYNKALMEGKAKVRRLPIMLIGQNRAGKTSLKRSLKGEKFNANENSTSGIEVDPSHCEVTTEAWKLQNPDQNSSYSLATSFEHQAARLVVNEFIDTKETCNGTNGAPTDSTHNSQAKYDPSMTCDSLQSTHGISHSNDSA